MISTRKITAGAWLAVLAALVIAGSAVAAPSLTITPTEGPVKTPLVITGSGFAPGGLVDLKWQTVEGNRVSGAGFGEVLWPYATVVADSTGAFRLESKAPEDLGGPAHRIEARIGDNVTAQTSFTITRTAEITPKSGPIGTMITLHMTGGGWTQYDNIVAVTYDNSFIGFMCSFNSQGNMTLWLPATGDVGLHTIDVWPALYWGTYPAGAAGPTPWKIAHIADGDQPTKIPKFHFEFQLTPGDLTVPNVVPDPGQVTVVSDAVAAVATAKAPMIALSKDMATPGSDYLLAGGGFKAGDTVKLTWATVTVKEEIKKDKNLGWNATPVVRDLGTAVASPAGTFVVPLTTPYDFGGDHTIRALVDGKEVSQTSIRVQPRFEFVGPNSVNAGEKVNIRGYGLGSEQYTAVWSVLYDNKLNGWVSAFDTNGNATFDVYAVGAPGKHFIDIHEGSNGWPYLNLWESPWPWEPAQHFSFEIKGKAMATMQEPLSKETARAEAPFAALPLLLGGIAVVALALGSRRRGGDQ
ncbi:MAG: hypothetical protein WDA16_08530 [Candidatus Thermoplasmatota archaeon]